VIEVTVRMLPKGDAQRARVMGRMLITNDGTGSAARGNYKVAVYARTNQKPHRITTVKQFPRKAFSVWILVFTALACAFGKGK